MHAVMYGPIPHPYHDKATCGLCVPCNRKNSQCGASVQGKRSVMAEGRKRRWRKTKYGCYCNKDPWAELMKRSDGVSESATVEREGGGGGGNKKR